MDQILRLIGTLINRLDGTDKKLDRIEREVHKIMATQSELAEGLKQVKEVLVKVEKEERALLVKIDELGAIIANNPVSAEVQAAYDAVKVQAGILDDVVPDAPPV